jgi:hypothetical protein
MASALVVRASAGTMTNPDQRQRLIEHQAASKAPLSSPSSSIAQPSPLVREGSSPKPQSGLPIVDGEVGFTTSLLAQRLVGKRLNYAQLSRSTQSKSPQTRLKDFLV